MASELKRHYDMCSRINQRHGRIFYYSSVLYPKAVRRSLDALFAFVRVSHEMVDNPPAGSDPAENLDMFRGATLLAIKHDGSPMPILDAFADTVRRWGIRPEVPLAFLDAVDAGRTRSRFDRFEDVQEHAASTARLVAVMACAILRATDDTAKEHAQTLATAVQLTDYWSHIADDWQTNRRIYLPQEDMRRFGYTEAMLANREVNDAFRSLLRFEIGLTRTVYAAADQGLGGADLPVKLARTLYARILDKIEQNSYDVFGRPPTTTGLERAAALFRLRFGTT